MKKVILFVISVAVHLQLYAQTNPQQGYIITLPMRTIPSEARLTICQISAICTPASSRPTEKILTANTSQERSAAIG